MYYDEDIKMPQSRIDKVRSYTEAMIADYESRNAPEKPSKKKSSLQETSDYIRDMHAQIESTHKRYANFAETVRTSLVTEALYDMYKKSVNPALLENQDNKTVMRNIVTSYVNETGYINILNRMKYASCAMSEMYTTIDKTSRKILESVDKSDADTFKIEPEDRDEFFTNLNKSDVDDIATAIQDRVATATTDFVNANNKDHDDITAALQSAQEKIDNVDPEDVELKECYEMQGRRKVNEIRRSPKNVFHGMVSSMCESVMKHPDVNAEFVLESNSHINMDKVVDRVSLMYTFVEMLNTSRLEKVDKAFIEGVIKDLAQ